VESTAVDDCNGVKMAMTHGQSRTAYTLEVRAFHFDRGRRGRWWLA
jgi:hypothetical protein